MKFVNLSCTENKSRDWLKIFPVTIIVIILSAIVVSVLSVYGALTILNPPKKPLFYFSSNIVPEYKDVYFKDINKQITLRGWYFTTSQNTRTVILSHGYGKNRFNFEEQSLEMIKKFLSRGYNVLAFDLRNSGKSDGKQFTLGYYERDDLLGAISYIRSQGIQKISLMGFSTGANAALLAAGQKISEVDAVIADTPYYSSEEFLQDAIFRITRLPSFPFSRFTSLAINMFTGINFADIDMSKVLARVSSKPFMMIYSSKDAIIPADGSKKLFAAYKNAQGVSGQLWETAATGHAESYLENPETYMENVLKFLDSIYIENPKK